MFASGIICTAIYKNQIWYAYKNYWSLILLFYILMHPFIAPNLELTNTSDQIISNLWQLRPLIHTLIYFQLMIVIQNINLS